MVGVFRRSCISSLTPAWPGITFALNRLAEGATRDGSVPHGLDPGTEGSAMTTRRISFMLVVLVTAALAPLLGAPVPEDAGIEPIPVQGSVTPINFT